MEYPTTRQQARETNSTYYYTGKPCKHGHFDKRDTKKGCCQSCRKIDWAKENKRRKDLPESEASKQSKRKYYEKNRDLVIARALARPEKDKRRYRRTWKKNNPELNRMSNNAWKRRQKDACPDWLSEGDRKRINNIYLEAQKISKATGERYVVDHIVPIRSDIVCGLHVPWNLRVVSEEINSSKNNKLLHDIIHV